MAKFSKYERRTLLTLLRYDNVSFHELTVRVSGRRKNSKKAKRRWRRARRALTSLWMRSLVSVFSASVPKLTLDGWVMAMELADETCTST